METAQAARALLSDPTALFTLGVVLVPLIYVDGASGAVQYLLTPMMVASVVYLGLILTVTHGNKGCVKVNPVESAMANWFLMNGIYFNLFLDVVSGQFQMMDEMSRQYLAVEPRYLMGPMSDAGAPVFMTSMLELFFQSPLALLTYYGYHHRKPYRHLCAFTVSVLHASGVWYFYVPEVIQGFAHLGGWPASLGEALSWQRILFFWFGFWFCGLLWLYVPFQICKYTWGKICASVALADERGAAEKAS